MKSWDADFFMDSFERGDLVIAPDEAAKPYDCSSKAIFKFDRNKEVTATSNNVSYALNKLKSTLDANATNYAVLDGLDSNPYAVSAEEIRKFRLRNYNFDIKDLRRPKLATIFLRMRKCS